ncbi:MAG: TauD/TfdA family dioxygenase [Pseudomonadota bacterium]
MRALKITGTIGAEIEGLDLAQPISPDLAEALRDALSRHLVLMVRGQRLDLAAHKRLTAVFGPLATNPYVTGLPEDPGVIRVLKEADDRSGVFGGDWHSDMSFLAEPPGGSVLRAVEIPPYGGDTLFANAQAAWETLSPGLRDLLAGREAAHVGKPHGVRWAPPMATRSRGAIQMVRGDPAADEERWHPAVVRDPGSGREALYLNPIYVTRLEGLSEEESAPILEVVRRHTIRPEFCCRLRWSEGAVAIWDNFATLHYAVNDYAGFRREMIRTAFQGPPIAERRIPSA